MRLLFVFRLEAAHKELGDEKLCNHMVATAIIFRKFIIITLHNLQ